MIAPPKVGLDYWARHARELELRAAAHLGDRPALISLAEMIEERVLEDVHPLLCDQQFPADLRDAMTAAVACLRIGSRCCSVEARAYARERGRSMLLDALREIFVELVARRIETRSESVGSRPRGREPRSLRARAPAGQRERDGSVTCRRSRRRRERRRRRRAAQEATSHARGSTAPAIPTSSRSFLFRSGDVAITFAIDTGLAVQGERGRPPGGDEARAAILAALIGGEHGEA